MYLMFGRDSLKTTNSKKLNKSTATKAAAEGRTWGRGTGGRVHTDFFPEKPTPNRKCRSALPTIKMPENN